MRVTDNHGNTLAYGFFDSKSEITCKLFEFSTDDSLIFDQAYWTNKITVAFQLRQQTVLKGDTNCCRLIHAEGDGLPGLIVDVYAAVAVAQVLHKGIEMIFPQILNALNGLGIKSVYTKTKTSSKHIENLEMPSQWHGQVSEMPIEVTENGLKFRIDMETGQKTGFFIDQRENRQLLQSYSEGKAVLNTFSYTGGFSVYAAAGGAVKIDSVDISKPAVEACSENMVLNFPDFKNHRSIAADCFDYLKHMETEYDIIVLDPPAFAKNAHAVKNATRGYKEINLMAFKKIKPGGVLFTFSCSKNIDRVLFRKIIFGAAADSGRDVKILHQLTQPPDHPVSIYHPEGEYLKGLVLWVA